MEWEPVIGLEVHVQLTTKSKIFSGAATKYGAPPNTQACAIDLALPGTLPVLNMAAVHMAIKFGLAINAHINTSSILARKNYFYPDLPKGYQISQYELPIVGAGKIAVPTANKNMLIGITRAHLEEDAGKSLHQEFAGFTAIDLNRAGTPLLEIVSEPDLRSAAEAVAYLKTLYNLVTYLGICDGNMQEGSFRCDANVSVRPLGSNNFGTRTEIKNINSFRFVEKAINYEILRQIDVISNQGTVVQETLLYDSNKHVTRSMRSKEEAHDYRYFPDPDLLPIEVSQTMLEEIRLSLPELPAQKHQRFLEQYSLSNDITIQLINDLKLASFFEETVKLSKAPAKIIANWVTGEVLAALNKDDLETSKIPISSAELAELLSFLADNKISNKIAKQIFIKIWQGQGSAAQLISAEDLEQVDTNQLEKIIDELIQNYPAQFADLVSGKEKIFGFFVGKIMQATQGKANPQQINQILKEQIAKNM